MSLRSLTLKFTLIVIFSLFVVATLQAQSDKSFTPNPTLKNLIKIAYDNCDSGDSILFKRTNKLLLGKARFLKDTFSIAEAHWNYGIFYNQRESLDSAFCNYYQAHKYYLSINHEYFQAKMLFNMAFIQSSLNDYINSEEKLFEAIEIYDRLDKGKSLYLSFKLLGNIYRKKGDYEKALNFHSRALKSIKVNDDKDYYYRQSLNSIALIHREIGEYDMAIKYFEEALKDKDLKNKDIEHYARIKDNLAYTLFLNNDLKDVKGLMTEALNIRDSIQDFSGLVINKIHLAELHLSLRDSSKALIYAKHALKNAKEISNNDNILTTLNLLSNIDPVNSSKYLEEYIELSEELRMYENNLRNKFARIRFETDEYIEENEKLTLRNTITLIGTIVIIIVLSLLYFLRVQRSKNRTLLLEKEQQLANEEIYKLMLRQKNTLEEGRLKERQRISEELHDGILGKIFSTRIGLGFLNFDASKEDIEKHEEYIDNLQTIEKEIRDISHDLKSELLSSKSNYISLIEDLIIERSKLFDFNYKIEKNDTSFWNDASNTIKVNIYRIIQELLQNMVKHAEANNICVNFDYVDDSLLLRVEDDGKGFNTENKTRGIGLTNIDKRINSINGELRIISKIGSGTVTEIKIPFN